MSRPDTIRVKKEVLLELVSRDIKELQKAQSDGESGVNVFTNSADQSQLLCDHLDHAMMHGLREFEDGYWPFVSYFTRNELVDNITHLKRVTTSIGKGRSWLYTALNERSLESYVRMFAENQDIVQDYYLRDAFLRDIEHLLLLLTLVSGLDYISFGLEVDCDYLDYGASQLSSQLTSRISLEVRPSFLSAKVESVVQPRSTGDSAPKLPQALPSSKKVHSTRERDISASYTGGGDTVAHVETESEHASLHKRTSSENIRTPSTGVGKSPMMSSSLQMTSSRNLLERMSSLESRSPFLERKTRENRERGEGEGGKVVNVRGGTKKHNKDDDIVAKGRRSGKGKKKRKGGSDGVSSRGQSSYHKASHMTQTESHVSSHEPESASAGMESGRDDIRSHGATEEKTRSDSIPSDTQFIGTEEWDFEMEPRQTVTDRHISPLMGRKRGEEGEKGGGMTLEQELELASRDIDSSEREKTPRYSGNPFGDEDTPSTSPTSPPHTLTHNQKHTGHTTQPHISHHSHGSERSKSKLKTERDDPSQQNRLKMKPQSSSQDYKTWRREKGARSESDGEFDVITRSEVREICDTRPRADAVFTVEKEREGEREEGEREGVEMVERDPGLVMASEVKYDGLPKRPQYITERDRTINDIKIDETMRVVFSIDVYLPETDRLSSPPDGTGGDRRQRVSQHTEEDARRLVQVNTPVGMGQYRAGYILITTEAVYMLRRDGIEGNFSREFGARYRDIDQLVIGLGWQSLELVYRDSTVSEGASADLQNCVILTGSEAVSRSVMESIQTAATACQGFSKVIPKNRDDETRVEAIEKELIKLGSETSMDIVQYSFVNWEQVKGEGPDSIPEECNKDVKSGLLHYKSTTRLGLSSWKQAFFKLVEGTLHQLNNESDKMSRATYPLGGCGQCKRVSGESRQFVLSITLDNAQPLLLATTTEDDLIQWQQALCEAVIQVPPATSYSNLMCTVLLTKGKVHILQEDLSSKIVRHITCCEVTAVEKIGIDPSLPLYCAVFYDDGGDCNGVWLLCFNLEYELGKFERALASIWKEQFQIDMSFSELEESTIRERAHHTVDLMQTASLRSDSVTRGRTEFQYSSDV